MFFMPRPVSFFPNSVLTLLLCLFAFSSARANDIWVTTLADENNTGTACSLREAIVSANTDQPFGGCQAGSGTDNVTFIVTKLVGTANISSPLPDITSAMNVLGNGADLNIVAGNSTFRLLKVALPANARVIIRGLSFTGGRRVAPGNAGAVEFDNPNLNSSLAFDRCEFYGNSGAGGSDGSSTLFATGWAFLVLEGSTFRNNSTEHVVHTTNNPFLTFTNVTISDNTGAGAGIYAAGITPGWTITNSTITNNNIGLWHANASNDASIKVKSSIFSGNPGGNLKRGSSACPNSTNSILSDGYNIFDDDPASNLCTPAATDLENTDPQLKPLAINGGGVRTRSPIYGSPALDKIPVSTPSNFPFQDQRNVQRPQHGTADVGAVEFAGYVANSNALGDFSLKEAIETAPPGTTIEFDPAFFSTPRTITISDPLIRFLSVHIKGPGADRLTLKGNGAYSLMVLLAGINDVITVEGMSFTEGGNSSTSVRAIYFTSTQNGTDAGTLNINGCEFYNHNGAGGSVINTVRGRKLSFNSSTIRNNSGLYAVYADRTPIDLINSTVSGNSVIGSAIYTSGGGVSNIISSTITGNSSGVANTLSSGSALLHIKNSIFSANGGQNLLPYSDFIFTDGHNLIDDTTWSEFNNSDASDLKGASFDAKLAPIGNYGGPTSTHALKAGSAAIDAGTSDGVPTVDQRGAPRVIGAAADIGAFERNVTFDQASAPTGRAGFAYNNGVPFQLSVTRQTAFTAMKDAPPVTLENAAAAVFSVVPISGQVFPAGMTLSPDGKLSGTPTTGGNYTFTIKAVDTDGMAGAQQFAMLVLAPPTAASVSVSGRVTDAAGRALARTAVTMTGMSGTVRTALTNAFGYYSFDGVQAGETYVFSVSSKGYRFDSRAVNVGEELTSLDFTPRF